MIYNIDKSLFQTVKCSTDQQLFNVSANQKISIKQSNFMIGKGAKAFHVQKTLSVISGSRITAFVLLQLKTFTLIELFMLSQIYFQNYSHDKKETEKTHLNKK